MARLLVFVTTLVIVVIAVVLTMISIINFFLLTLSSTEVENRFRFITVLNRPYEVGEVLSGRVFNEKTFLEHALETSIAGSLENASSSLGDIAAFLEFYKFGFYEISIYPDSGLINVSPVFFSKEIMRCGIDQSGVCSPKPPESYNCGVGRVRIDDNNICSFNEICCQENVEAYLAADSSVFRVEPCGPEGENGEKIGICTQEKRVRERSGYIRGEPQYTTRRIKTCETGRVLLEDSSEDCMEANDGATPICCAPVLDEAVSRELSAAAQIPLLYKGKTLFEPKKYLCQDSKQFSCEGGQYVRSMCNGPPEIQCCVIDIIRCKPPYGRHMCINADACADENEIDGNELCPTAARPKSGNLVCCKDTEPAVGEENAVPVTPKGECSFDTPGYSAGPLEGSVRILVSGKLAIGE